jgi:hypothetical protein
MSEDVPQDVGALTAYKPRLRRPGASGVNSHLFGGRAVMQVPPGGFA